MHGKSEFDLINERYVVRNGKLIFAAIVPSYAGPLVDKLREVEKKRSADHAFDQLTKISSTSLDAYVRKATDLDAIKIHGFLKNAAMKHDRGAKYRCNCGTAFYDRGFDEAKCPTCFKHKTFGTKVGWVTVS